MLSKEELLAADFREHKPTSPIFKYDLLYQKAVKDAAGRKKYYVNVQYWDNTKYPGGHIGWDATGQFPFGNDRLFNFTLFISDRDSVQDVLDFFEKMWRAMECRTYD